jgi:hypothetical protein
MKRPSVHFLVDLTLNLYPNVPTKLNSAIRSRLSQLSLDLIEDRISYRDCFQSSLSLTGTSYPIEKLNEILTIPPIPIPFENDHSNETERRKKTRPWSDYEDSRLLAGILRYGAENWASISLFVGNGRTRSQCAQRWSRGLDPRLSRDQWTHEEDRSLMEFVQFYGDQAWTKVAARFGNRSDVQCRYRYKQLQKDRMQVVPKD